MHTMETRLHVQDGFKAPAGNPPNGHEAATCSELLPNFAKLSHDGFLARVQVKAPLSSRAAANMLPNRYSSSNSILLDETDMLRFQPENSFAGLKYQELRAAAAESTGASRVSMQDTLGWLGDVRLDNEEVSSLGFRTCRQSVFAPPHSHLECALDEKTLEDFATNIVDPLAVGAPGWPSDTPLAIAQQPAPLGLTYPSSTTNDRFNDNSPSSEMDTPRAMFRQGAPVHFKGQSVASGFAHDVRSAALRNKAKKPLRRKSLPLSRTSPRKMVPRELSDDTRIYSFNSASSYSSSMDQQETVANSSHAMTSGDGEFSRHDIVKRVSSSNGGLFPCPYPDCNARTTTRFSLKRHMKRHTGERPFVCSSSNCGKRFAEKSTLKRHMLVHGIKG